MPFDYQGAKAAGYSDAEIQEFLSPKSNAMPPPPTNIPYGNNMGASQKFQEGYAAEAGKTAAGQSFQNMTRDKIRGSLDAVSKRIETMNTEGGYSPLYDNESLAFGVLPGVKPTIQFLRSQGASDIPLIGDVGKGLTNRESQQANVGMLAAQLKSIIRQPGEGVWTDKDQEFLLRMLPQGAGYETDKNIVKALEDGSLLQAADEYRQSPEWRLGLEPPNNKPAANAQPAAKPAVKNWTVKNGKLVPQ
jgi:hypothetical protein